MSDVDQGKRLKDCETMPEGPTKDRLLLEFSKLLGKNLKEITIHPSIDRGRLDELVDSLDSGGGELDE